MNERLRKLLEARARVWEEMKAIRERADENGLIRGEDEEAWTRANADLVKFGEQIEEEERNASLERVDRSRIPTPRDEDTDRPDNGAAYRSAFQAFIRGGMSDLDPEQRKVLRSGLVKEDRAQGVGTASAGGYTVPTEFRNRLVDQMLAFGSVAAVAEVIDTDTGATIEWPTLNDTANVGAILAENTQVTEQDMTVGQADIGAYKYTSKLIRVSLELLQDSAFDIEGLLARKLGERIARIQNQHFTTGTGTAQPQGIAAGATTGVTAASTTAITWDELISLEHSVDPAYRDRGQYMLPDAALAALRKLKDANNNYLWQPSTQAGVASSINGRPYVINNDLPTPAANTESVLFGDFREGYLVRRVTGVQLVRLDERYADFGQVGFLAFARADGAVQNASAYKALSQAAV